MKEFRLKFVFKGHQQALKDIEHIQELIRDAQATMPVIEGLKVE